jgi:phage terminase small subunit
MALTKKRRVWLEAYLQTWNATEAARQAGYSFPNKSGPALLKDEHIRQAIDERLESEHMKASEALALIARKARKGNLRALELIGKAHRLFVDRVEHEGGERPIQVVIEYVDDPFASEVPPS